MDETKKYNGWTNYETWNVKLWIDNDRGSYDYWREITRATVITAQANDHLTKAERATGDLADKLKEDFEMHNPLDGASTYTDLLGNALSQVNWYEIAESLINQHLDIVQSHEGL